MAKTPVLITGAGPTGLVLAIWLRKKGVEVRIIDKSKGPGLTSRALAVQARTLEFYRQLGIVDDLVASGIVVSEIVMRRNSHVVGRGKVGDIGRGKTPFPYLLFCSQDVHEELLCRVLRELGTEVERETELLDFRDEGDKISATLRTPRGNETVSADYLCGCDGAHSTARHGLDLKFSGGTYSQVFYVADVIAGTEAQSRGLEISLTTKDFCIIMPIRLKGSVRLTGVVPPESEGKDHITYDDVSGSVNRNTGLTVSEVRWFSSYHVHHRVAEAFRKGRVFIAGDAGHIHSPAGGQGMNTGIGDAVNLAWKLADVLQGRFSEKLLDSYNPERISFAKVLIKSTDTAFKLVANRSWLGSIFRAYLLPTLFSLLSRTRYFLDFMFRVVSQTRIEYRDSFLSSGAAGGLQAGDRLPWLEVDNFAGLRSLDWRVQVYGNMTAEIKAAAEALKIGSDEFPWNRECSQKGFVQNALYLIRPDGHIALISEQQPPALKDYFKKRGGLR